MGSAFANITRSLRTMNTSIVQAMRAAGSRFGLLASTSGTPHHLAFTSGARGYHKNVVEHYENPRNVGAFDKKDPMVGTGLVGAPACGDVMKLQIKVDENGFIVDR